VHGSTEVKASASFCQIMADAGSPAWPLCGILVPAAAGGSADGQGHG
jgi:hypothetical protein